MNKQSWLLNLSLLKTHPAFRAVFLARFISIVSLGLLGVAVPVQIQMMTHSSAVNIPDFHLFLRRTARKSAVLGHEMPTIIAITKSFLGPEHADLPA